MAIDDDNEQNNIDQRKSKNTAKRIELYIKS